MVGRVQNHNPPPGERKREDKQRLVITLACADNALVAQVTAPSPEEAPEAASAMLMLQPHLQPGYVMRVLRAPDGAVFQPRDTD